MEIGLRIQGTNLTDEPSNLRKPDRPRVLIADDEDGVRRVLARVLTAAGFDTEAASDGLRAAALLERETFDAILTDVSMPGMGGIDVLRAVRKRDLDVPVLLITGDASVESAVEAIRQGATDYIVKPFNAGELTRKVRKAVDVNWLSKAKRQAMTLLGTAGAQASDRAGLDVTLTRALETLWMAYQPIVDISKKRLFAYEALLRSNEPFLPSPGAVLDAAQRLVRTHEVGRAIRQRVAEPFASGPPEALLFVNVDASDLADDTLTSRSSPLSGLSSRVVLEITERASLERIGNVRAVVAHLRELGYRIAIDDLGAGYAGLNSFAKLEPEFVKLDMSLVRDVHLQPVKQKVVRSMTHLCGDMGIAVVAEGVEHVEERDVLVELGCTLMQGYLFAKPGKPFPTVDWA